MARLLLIGEDGREMSEHLLPALLQEVRLVPQLDSQYERYRGITAKTLLLAGGKSPAYVREVLPVLAATIPQAKLIEFPRFDHNAPDLKAPDVIASTLKDFFAANPTS